MKGFFMQKNEELVLMLGEVKKTVDCSPKYAVTIEYDVYENGENVKKRTEIFFQNQQPVDGSEKKPVLWADIARNMHMHEGSVIAVLARPNEAKDKADGYVCRYNGVIVFRPDEKHERERHAVGGLVTWLNDKVDKDGKPYVSMGVYTGKDKDGDPTTVNIKTKDEKMMERCKKALTPREDGTKKRAWFKCGEPFMAMNGNADEYPIYTAFDFSITGTYKKEQQ